MEKRGLATALASTVSLCASVALAAPFGGQEDVSYAERLWQQMAERNLVGKEAVMSTPYQGTHPHGEVLDTIDAPLTVGGNTGRVIVKRNYGGEGVSKSKVADNPEQWLQSVTVMYRRSGYDPENQDWFWVKYAPDGAVLKNPKDMPLAGRVGKGGDQGCVPCHSSAPGGDRVFNNDRLAR